AERHGREPIDADVNVLRRFLAAGNIEVAPARRAGADEDRVPTFGEQRLHAVDTLAAAEFDAEAEDVAGLLVDHAVRQAEFRNLRADHAAGLRIAVEHHHVVTERRQIARDRERGRPAADQGDALAVFLLRGLRQPRGNVVLVIGGDALQAADCYRLVLDADAAAGRFARAVAGASENSGKHVRVPVDHVSVGVTARRDQPDIFRDGRVRRTRPLAIHDLVEILRRRNVGILHSLLETRPATPITRTVSRRSLERPPFPRRGQTLRPRFRAGNIWLRTPQ